MITQSDGFSDVFFPEPPLVMEPGTFEGTKEELAAVIAKQVENYPSSFHMTAWVRNTGAVIYGFNGGYSPHRYQEHIKRVESLDGSEQCGTTMCIAGYAQLFVDGKITEDVQERAGELLGLDSECLFFVSNEEGKRLLNALADGTYTEEDARQAYNKRARETSFTLS